jgi:serine/threonine-protein kinase
MKICPRCQELYPDHLKRCPRDAQDLRQVQDPLLGRTIGGRYRLISRLGAGGMSAVYLARHVMIDRLMAIKTLRRDLAKDPIQRDRFIREARAVNRINHANIVEITDFGETDDGLVYLVMEYVPGEPLLKSMGDGPMDVERAFHIAKQTASALCRAHEMGVVHRDLKPENILLVPRREHPDFVKVLDFGIAKILDAPSLTGSQQIFGTPGYIAPEYIQSTDIDGRADLYSLGVILYEMITGALPFDYEYPGDLLVKHVTEEPIPPRERYSRIEPAVEELILKCLAKDPNERFRDAFHFLDELERVWELVGSPDSWGGLDENSEPGDAWGEGRESDGSIARPTLVDGVPDATEIEPVVDVSKDAAVSLDDQETPEMGEPRRSHPTAEYGRPEIPEPPAVADVAVPEEVSGPTPESGSARRADPERDGLLGVRKWRERYDAIRGCLDEIEHSVASPPEVMQAMAFALGQLDRLETEGVLVEVKQRRLEELDETARDFRSTLGKAIDTLAGRLSNARGEFEELVNRRNRLRTRREAMRQKVRTGEAKEGPADAVLWELAAVEEKVQAKAAVCDELEVHVSELRSQLEAKNEEVEGEIAETVQLLGRRMSGLEEVAHALRDPLSLVEAYVVEAWPEEGLGGGGASPPSAAERDSDAS